MASRTTGGINILALDAQADILSGASTSDNRSLNVWNLIAAFLEDINKLEIIHGNNFNNPEAFVDRCEKKIEHAAKAFNPNIQDFAGLVKCTLRQAVKDFYKRKSSYKRLHDSYEYVTPKYEGIDRSLRRISTSPTIIADYVISKEFYGFLMSEYGTDDKRRYIIDRWTEEGKIKNTELAREMVGEFGGKESAHVQFIKRLRKQMRQETYYKEKAATASA